MALLVRVAVTSLVSWAVFALLLFVSAGTLDYWQGWAFLGVFTAVSLIATGYLAMVDPAALERRMHAGPSAENRPRQKLAMSGISVCFVATLVVAALDRRFGWSDVPVAVSVAGLVMVAAGLGAAMFVVVQNPYAAANITVEEGQPLAETDLYAAVRHPMYTGGLVMMAGMPLALGSSWALLVTLAGLVLLVVRILDEETMLAEELPGYPEYMIKVRYRLIPLVW